MIALAVNTCDIPEIMNISSCAKVVGKDRHVVANWINTQGLPALKVNKSMVYITKRDFLEWWMDKHIKSC